MNIYLIFRDLIRMIEYLSLILFFAAILGTLYFFVYKYVFDAKILGHGIEAVIISNYKYGILSIKIAGVSLITNLIIRKLFNFKEIDKSMLN